MTQLRILIKIKKFKEITEQVPKHVNELYDAGSTKGAFILFPNKRIDGKYTINQARGINTLINDRFDLTLECIRRYYKAEKSPLYETFLRYNCFFNLFETFEGYVNFFLLNDSLDNKGNIRFYLPFEEFKKDHNLMMSVNILFIKKERTMNFIEARNKRIKNKMESK